MKEERSPLSLSVMRRRNATRAATSCNEWKDRKGLVWLVGNMAHSIAGLLALTHRYLSCVTNML